MCAVEVLMVKSGIFFHRSVQSISRQVREIKRVIKKSEEMRW
jgi:hypothetical protein